MSFLFGKADSSAVSKSESDMASQNIQIRTPEEAGKSFFNKLLQALPQFSLLLTNVPRHPIALHLITLTYIHSLPPHRTRPVPPVLLYSNNHNGSINK